MANLLAQVQVQGVAERLADQRRERLGRPGQALCDLVLVGARIEKRRRDQRALGGGELAHRHPDDAGDLEDPLL